MGVAHVDAVARQLLEAGRNPRTPAAAIQWGTREEQRIVVATLATLALEIARHDLRSPAVIVIGDVVRLRDSLSWVRADREVEATMT
jgi:siroheme synthase